MAILDFRMEILDLRAQYLTARNACSLNLKSTIINHKFYRDWPFEDPATRERTKYARIQSRAIPQDSEEGPFKDGN
jgi:hypothetical protein